MAARVGVSQTCEADVLKSDTTDSGGGDLMLAVGGRLEDTGRKCCLSGTWQLSGLPTANPPVSRCQIG